MGAHRWAGGNRQLEGSPIYGAAKGWAVDSKQTPWLSVSIGLAFWPEHSPSSLQYHCLSHMYQSYQKKLVQVFAFYRSFFFHSSHTGFQHHNTAALCHGVRAVYFGRDFCDLLLDTLSWVYFFSSSGDSMKPKLQTDSSTIWFMNQFEYRTQQLVMHVDFLSDTISS